MKKLCEMRNEKRQFYFKTLLFIFYHIIFRCIYVYVCIFVLGWVVLLVFFST